MSFVRRALRLRRKFVEPCAHQGNLQCCSFALAITRGISVTSVQLCVEAAYANRVSIRHANICLVTCFRHACCIGVMAQQQKHVQARAITEMIKWRWNRACQRCWHHTPRTRRQCGICGRRVGSGCRPEYCLIIDGYDGEGRPSICRDCWPGYGPAPVSRDFYEIWKIVQARGF